MQIIFPARNLFILAFGEGNTICLAAKWACRPSRLAAGTTIQNFQI